MIIKPACMFYFINVCLSTVQLSKEIPVLTPRRDVQIMCACFVIVDFTDGKIPLRRLVRYKFIHLDSEWFTQVISRFILISIFDAEIDRNMHKIIKEAHNN